MGENENIARKMDIGQASFTILARWEEALQGTQTQARGTIGANAPPYCGN